MLKLAFIAMDSSAVPKQYAYTPPAVKTPCTEQNVPASKTPCTEQSVPASKTPCTEQSVRVSKTPCSEKSVPASKTHRIEQPVPDSKTHHIEQSMSAMPTTSIGRLGRPLRRYLHFERNCGESVQRTTNPIQR